MLWWWVLSFLFDLGQLNLTIPGKHDVSSLSRTSKYSPRVNRIHSHHWFEFATAPCTEKFLNESPLCMYVHLLVHASSLPFTCTCYIADLQRISNFISAISILFCDRFRFILLLLSSLGWSSSTPVLALIYLSKLRYTALFFNRDGNLSVIHWPSFIIFSFGCLVSFLDNTCHSFFSFENPPHELLDSLRFLFPMLIDTLPAWLDTWHIFTLA